MSGYSESQKSIDEKFVFNLKGLKADNNGIILTGQMFSPGFALEGGIASIQENGGSKIAKDQA